MEYSKTIHDLPLEMIIEVFAYLSLSDLKEASLVCNLWYDALYHSKTLSRIILNLNTTNYDKYKTIMKKRNFYNVKFYEIDFHKKNEDIKLWQEIGQSLQMLMFRDCTFTINELVSILQTTQNLKQLNIEICNFVEPIENISEATCLSEVLKNVTKLKFEILNSTNIKLFKILVEMMPNLQNLEVDRSSFSQINNEMFNILKTRALTLKGLCIYNYAPTELIESIIKIENLKLNEFNFNTGITPSLSKSIYMHQPFIKKLYFIQCNNDNIKHISNHMLHIQTLYVKFAYSLDDESIADMWKLRNLKYLQLNNCERVTANGFIKGFKEINNNLQSITLRLKSPCENLILHITEKFHKLRELEIHCNSEFTDNDFQSIWKNLTLLRSLNLICNFSSKISDFAFTGKYQPEENCEENEGYSISSVKGLQYIDLTVGIVITVATLKEIGNLNELICLKATLSKSKFEFEDLKILSKCKSLETLDIQLSGKLPPNTRKAMIQKLFGRVKNFNIRV